MVDITQQGEIGNNDKPSDCFLCVLDSQPCTIKQLEGRIRYAREFRHNGTSVPVITLDVEGQLVSISLSYHYERLVKDLISLGNSLKEQHLTMRVYHLPPSSGTVERQGNSILHYNAGDYTLAILEPDTILNITDLNAADYCARQYLLNRLVASPQSPATARGNLVHSSFKELLKEHDRGELMYGHVANGEETPLATLQRHFERALERSALDLAITDIQPDVMRAEVEPHLVSLANWFEKQHATLWDMPAADQDEASENMVRAETFLIAPEIGLRGRLDLLWKQRSRQRLLELKTGGASGDLPKSAHRWQAQGYLALLAVRRNPKMKNALATLLYSGTPGEAVDFNLRFTIKQFQRVIETRNILVFSHVTGIPAPPPGPSRCAKCAMLDSCQEVSALLDWQPPQTDVPSPDLNGQPPSPARDPTLLTYSEADRTFFSTCYRLLHIEGLEAERQQMQLWKTPLKERVEQGSAIGALQLIGKPEPTGQGEWLQTFACANTSELREGDEVLLSDGDPITGEVVTATIIQISSQQVTLWSPELIAHPRLIDRYETNIVHVRTLQNLLRWLQADARVRQLVSGTLRPHFTNVSISPAPALNDEQRLAVERAMQMQDYLLIHGPPGTGKTSVIAEIVKRLCQQGQRVLLAAFTNQAVDNMLKRLEREGVRDFARLGHDRSVDDTQRHRLLKHLFEPQETGNEQDSQQSVRALLNTLPIVASTTATWSSEKYTPLARQSEDESAPLAFDVAIIDEAGQLTTPAILGALRFARRFILVGDEKQLPPLVLSKQAARESLNESLFSKLKRIDEDYMKDHVGETSACVSLKVQYRMNAQISHFASKMFYAQQLQPHASIKKRLLAPAKPGAHATEEAPSITRSLEPLPSLAFLDVSSSSADRILDGPKTSNAEARTIREIVAGLLARGIEEGEIGIIAPYRAQVACIRRYLFSNDEESGWQALPQTTALSVDTVDRFQGGERTVMLLSFATTTTPEAGSQLRQHLTDPNRLNVALTRAQRKMILVGHAQALEALPYFRNLLAYCRALETVFAHTPAPLATTPR